MIPYLFNVFNSCLAPTPLTFLNKKVVPKINSLNSLFGVCHVWASPTLGVTTERVFI